MARLATAFAMLLALNAAAASQQLIKDIKGVNGTRFGQSVLIVEDLNGDGWREMLVGAPMDGTRGSAAGAVFVMTTEPTRKTALSTLYADLPAERFGWSMASIGDQNGDGFQEIAISSWGYYNGGNYAGRVQLFTWQPGTPGTYVSLWSSVWHESDAYFGWSVSGVGDVNNDRVLDVLAGAPYGTPARSGPGTAALLSGRDGSILTTVVGRAVDDHFGRSVCGLGDVNGDGKPDWAVGAPLGARTGWGADAGYVWVFSTTGVQLGELGGYTPNERYGVSIANVGDVDNDSVPDFAIGSRFAVAQATTRGSIDVCSGATLRRILKTFGEDSGDEFGVSLASGIDLDGDGAHELIVGTPGDDTAGQDAGSAQVRHVPPSTRRAIALLDGSRTGDGMGTVVAVGPGAGGVRPPHGPLVVNASPVAGSNTATDGRVRVYDYGRSPYEKTWIGANPGDLLGMTVDALGDVDGDGYDDFAYGIAGDDTAGPDAGQVVVMSGRTCTSIRTIFGQAGLEVGTYLRGTGDVDGDGLGDLALRRGTDNILVMSPATNSTLFTMSTLNAFPGSVGDLNGDGYAEIAVFQVGDPGNVWLIDRKAKQRTTLVGGASCVEGIGDVDGDGCGDFAIVRRGGVSSLEVYSGRTMSTLKVHSPTSNGTFYRIAGVGDTDRDGVPDYAASEWTVSTFSSYGLITAFSGRTHQVIVSRVGRLGEQLGHDLIGAGDVNGDGILDVAASGGAIVEPRVTASHGVTVIAGDDYLSHLAIVEPARDATATASRLFSKSLGAGDFDGDGLTELVVGYPSSDPNARGKLGLLDFDVTPPLSADRPVLSVTGGSITFALVAPRTLGGRRFVMAGSLSGTYPGTPLNATLTLPVNFDAYFITLIAAPNTIVNPSIGNLDAAAKANAQFSIGVLPAAAVGLEVHHAYGVLDANNADFDFVSNAVRLTFKP